MSQRTDDPLYCAPCGWLFGGLADAVAHRREAHPDLEAAHLAAIEQRRQLANETPPPEGEGARYVRIGDRVYL